MRRLLNLIILLLPIIVSANEVKPPHEMFSTRLGIDVTKHALSYSHYRVIGLCEWMHDGLFPYVVTTSELSEYIPDLVVVVYNQDGDDPWFSAKWTIDPVTKSLGNGIVKMITGFTVDQGDNGDVTHGEHYAGLREKVVDVIGNPAAMFSFPRLRVDTLPMFPYFQSDLDILGQLGIAELLQPNTFNPLTHFVGDNIANHWSYEFPRSMIMDVDNDYKASVIAALRAADIVTNTNTLHTVKSVSDSCGRNCAVANVIEETSDSHEIFEEVYPHDRHIQLGQSDMTQLSSLGEGDNEDGHGNYVFIVWRQYKGCEQAHDASFLFATEHVPDTQKR